ncbi:MAG: MFS transporter [Halobacteriales archaeon]
MARRLRDGTLGDLREFDALLAASLIWFLGQFVRYVFPPLFETLRGQYGVSNTTLGLLFSLLMVGYAGMQFPSGAIADRIGTVRVITVGVLLVATAGWILALTDAFLLLGIAMLLLGIGSGFHKTVAIALLSIAYPDRTGRTLGTLDMFGQFGGVAAPAVVAFMLSRALDWRLLFVGVGVGGVALGIVFYFRTNRRLRAVGVDPNGGTTTTKTTAEDGSEKSGLGAYLTAFRTRRFLGIVVVAVTFSFTWTGITAFLPLYLTSEIGLRSTFAGVLYSSIFAVSLIQPFAGGVSDRIGHLPVMAGTLGVAGVALGTLIAVPPVLVVVAAVPMIGIGYHGCRPARDAYLVEAIPESVAGGTLGLVRTLMMGMGATAPALVGFLSDIAGFQLAFGVLLAALLGSIVILLVLLMTTDETPIPGKPEDATATATDRSDRNG